MSPEIVQKPILVYDLGDTVVQTSKIARRYIHEFRGVIAHEKASKVVKSIYKLHNESGLSLYQAVTVLHIPKVYIKNVLHQLSQNGQFKNQINPKVAEIIKENISAGYDVHALSNIPTWFEEYATSVCKHLHFKEPFFFSSQIGCAKPDKKIYKHVSGILKTKDIILIDNNKNNVNSAIEFGWRPDSIHYKNASQLRTDLNYLINPNG